MSSSGFASYPSTRTVRLLPSPDSGGISTDPTARTPGIVASESSNRWNNSCIRGCEYPFSDASIEKLTRLSARNPGSTSFRLYKLRANNPAPTSSTSDSATCPATSVIRSRACPTLADTFDAWSFSASEIPMPCDVRVDCSAGARPNKIPVASDSPSVNNSTRKSGVLESASFVPEPGRNFRSTRPLQYAIANPAAPPASASVVLSTSNCRITLARPAPSASRTAISFCRAAARASNRFATFAHAISITSPTIAINTISGFENCSRSSDCPRETSSTTIGFCTYRSRNDWFWLA